MPQLLLVFSSALLAACGEGMLFAGDAGSAIGTEDKPGIEAGTVDQLPLEIGASLPDAVVDAGPAVAGCITDADCVAPGRPFCAADRRCVACRSDADCAVACVDGDCAPAGTCGGGPRPAPGQTSWPVPAQPSVCQKFGNKISYQSCGFHTGIDVCTASGKAILSIADGKVVHVGYMWFSGAKTGRGPYAVIVEHAPGFYSTYGHNQKALVQKGDCVTRGQKIAEVGSLGYSTGPHLHFEILDGASFTGDWQVPFKQVCGAYRDPLKLLAP